MHGIAITGNRVYVLARRKKEEVGAQRSENPSNLKFSERFRPVPRTGNRRFGAIVRHQ